MKSPLPLLIVSGTAYRQSGSGSSQKATSSLYFYISGNDNAKQVAELERELAPLLQEKELLEKAVSDRRYEWYESDGPMRIGRIVEASTQTEDKSSRIRLDLDGKKLMWSQGSSGNNGFFY